MEVARLQMFLLLLMTLPLALLLDLCGVGRGGAGARGLGGGRKKSLRRRSCKRYPSDAVFNVQHANIPTVEFETWAEFEGCGYVAVLLLLQILVGVF